MKRVEVVVTVVVILAAASVTSASMVEVATSGVVIYWVYRKQVSRVAGSANPFRLTWYLVTVMVRTIVVVTQVVSVPWVFL